MSGPTPHIPDLGELQFQRARLLVGAMVRAGVRRAVTSPGSRSTPLVLACLDVEGAGGQAGLEVTSVIDERAAAFLALGQARATGLPTALICTSGSAAGHYFPAILEAREAGVPLIVLSADRPWDLMHCAAPQTTDQTRLFGAAVNFFAEVDLAGGADAASLRALRRLAAQAVVRSRSPRGGAVHLNVRARKPLEPPSPVDRGPVAELVDGLLDAPLDVAPARSPAAVDPDLLERAAALCRGAERGLIVAGPLPLPPPAARGAGAGAGLPDPAELARRTGFPLVAEATSQSRFVGPDARLGEACRAECLGEAWASAERSLPSPDLVLQVGAPPVSGSLQQFVASGGAPQIVFSDGPWTDPEGLASVFLLGNVEASVAALCARLEAPTAAEAGGDWRHEVQIAARGLRAAAGSASPGTGGQPLHDRDAAWAAVEATPADGLLMLGNSLPVRLVEQCPGLVDRRIWVASQRGLSGIDGLVAGFLGSLEAGEFPAGVLLIGDVSLVHDLDGLMLASACREGPPAAIVVIDNGGGRIFERLPIADTEAFRVRQGKHWLTPHGVDFAGLAQAFGLRYARAETAGELAEALVAALGQNGVTMVVAETRDSDPRDLLGLSRQWADDRALD